MELYINRRVRDKAMVLGLPAEQFMVCFAIMCAPVMIVLFMPLFTLIWIPWGIGVYKFFQCKDRLLRVAKFRKQFPTYLKNR